jgi:ubiquinone/menaquinone biosynthesis C-methylase UbiE
MNRYTSIAEYYDAENERLGMLQRDVPFFLKQIPARRKLSILELAAGTARAAIPIAQAGHQVVGVERDSKMLAIAKRKQDAVGLTDRQLNLIRGDVLTMNLRRKFDRVAIFFNTLLAFTTLDQQDRLLQNVRRHLKRNGRFWVDIFHPDHSMLAERHSKKLESSSFYVPALDRTVAMSVDVRRDMSRQWMDIVFNYKWFDSRGREHRQRARFEMTAIFPRELQLLLEGNGFKIDKLYGDYDGKPLTASSPRMIASCRIV